MSVWKLTWLLADTSNSLLAVSGLAGGRSLYPVPGRSAVLQTLKLSIFNYSAKKINKLLQLQLFHANEALECWIPNEINLIKNYNYVTAFFSSSCSLRFCSSPPFPAMGTRKTANSLVDLKRTIMKATL
jgi:hypothetical protein